MSFTIVPQTKVALIGYLILLVGMLVATFFSKSNVATIGSTIIFVLISALSLYILNCTVLGHCIVYAWVMAILVVIMGVVGGVALLSVALKK